MKIKYGTRRKMQGFLAFPKVINHERKWLKWAVWLEEYVEVSNARGIPIGGKWIPITYI